jgi:cytochrome c553
MTLTRFTKGAGIVTVLAAIAMLGFSLAAPRVQADEPSNDDWRIKQGFAIAPVRLNLVGKNHAQVGLGSYFVNALGDCNGCHTNNPATEYTSTGNPYLLPPVYDGTKKVNPATYLAGGQDFGQLVPGSAHIISRNLTPDKTGRPAGGRPFPVFLEILRTGIDKDHLHPNCAGAPGLGCVPFPFNGSLLQIMPWPTLQNLSDDDIQAIYTYLSAIPCIAGPPAPNPLHNDCE